VSDGGTRDRRNRRPRQVRLHAVGPVGEPGQKAADSAERGADGERDREEIAGRLAYPEHEFRRFDANEAADERADNRLALQEEDRIPEVLPSAHRIFEPVQHFAADGRPGDRSGNDRPAGAVGDNVAPSAALPQVDAEADEVGERLEDDVRVQPQGPKWDIDRKLHAVMLLQHGHRGST
jgi:hypothetical protein